MRFFGYTIKYLELSSQVLALLVCCTGIVLVSLFSTPKQKDITPKNTTFTDNLWDLGAEETKTSGSVLGYIVRVYLTIKSVFVVHIDVSGKNVTGYC